MKNKRLRTTLLRLAVVAILVSLCLACGSNKPEKTKADHRRAPNVTGAPSQQELDPAPPPAAQSPATPLKEYTGTKPPEASGPVQEPAKTISLPFVDEKGEKIFAEDKIKDYDKVLSKLNSELETEKAAIDDIQKAGITNDNYEDIKSRIIAYNKKLVLYDETLEKKEKLMPPAKVAAVQPEKATVEPPAQIGKPRVQAVKPTAAN